MTQVTPPGWYPDPGQTSDGPATERWWDGKAWTEQTRPAGSAAGWGPPAQTPAAGAYAAYPVYPAHPPAVPRRGLRTGIAVAVAAAVLASIGVGVYALAGNGGDGGDRAGSQQGSGGQGGPGGQGGGSEGQGGPFGGSGGDSGDGGSGGGPGGQSPSPGESGAPTVKGGGTISDPVNGISMRVPDGWTGGTILGGVQVTSDDSYKCPGEPSKTCTAGGASSTPAPALRAKGDTAEEVAKADIAGNAEAAYGGTTYGGITSHKVLASKAVTVAGQKGYLVRWQAVTSKGADGYVESLAFPSPANPQQMVVVRFGIDVGQKVSVIDDITKGIKASSGGGNGQNV
ncbi:DUF2510 domain-containing protein [Streptomyces sp. NPDC001480]|uniref:DUF2510 domain-containing protein n=1 Tax=Streptomyces sp. NPDC001480 TaxID=3364577 RepID=UPI0036878FB7